MQPISAEQGVECARVQIVPDRWTPANEVAYFDLISMLQDDGPLRFVPPVNIATCGRPTPEWNGYFLIPATAHAGKSPADAVAEIMKEKFAARTTCNHQQYTLQGSENQVAKLVECDACAHCENRSYSPKHG